jgi:hypothetical protein
VGSPLNRDLSKTTTFKAPQSSRVVKYLEDPEVRRQWWGTAFCIGMTRAVPLPTNLGVRDLEIHQETCLDSKCSTFGSGVATPLSTDACRAIGIATCTTFHRAQRLQALVRRPWCFRTSFEMCKAYIVRHSYSQLINYLSHFKDLVCPEDISQTETKRKAYSSLKALNKLISIAIITGKGTFVFGRFTRGIVASACCV